MYHLLNRSERAGPDLPTQAQSLGAVKTDERNSWDLPPQRELILLWALQGTGRYGAYGLDLQRAVEQCSQGRESFSIGSLYSLLKRLRSKGYVDSYEGDSLGGGARRQYYFLTEDGTRLVSEINQFFGTLQNWMPSS